jgi:hypothetical protein
MAPNLFILLACLVAPQYSEASLTNGLEPFLNS